MEITSKVRDSSNIQNTEILVVTSLVKQISKQEIGSSGQNMI